MSWHELKAGGDPSNPSDYTTPSGSPCVGTGKICQVNATSAGSQPVLTEALKDEMLQSMQSDIPGPNVKLRGTP